MMGYNRDQVVTSKVANFLQKLKSDNIEDRENVAYTKAHFIISMSKTLGYPVQNYIQHICGTGIPNDLSNARDQIFSAKLAQFSN